MTVTIHSIDEYMAIFGLLDEHIRLIEESLGVSIQARHNALHISGPQLQCEQTRQLLDSLLTSFQQGESIGLDKVRYYLSLLDASPADMERLPSCDLVAYTHRGRKILNKTVGQKSYTDAIKQHSLTICSGPAGTGKTFLAIALAATSIKNKEVERLILTRPAVEAGEKLGFLPGDMAQKVDPYLRPLYDALFDMMGLEGYQRLIEKGAIEVAPLAFMRGRTLSDAFIILDEAQNTTCEQMKMFLTRLGKNSRCVVNGDLTQIDLPGTRQSGLAEAMSLLRGIDDIAVVEMTKLDVVRNPLVQRIVEAYDAI